MGRELPAAVEVDEMDHAAAVTSLDVSKDGARIVSGGADKTVKLWTLADGKPAGAITTPAEVRGVSFNADGSRIIAAGCADKEGRASTISTARCWSFSPTTARRGRRNVSARRQAYCHRQRRQNREAVDSVVAVARAIKTAPYDKPLFDAQGRSPGFILRGDDGMRAMVERSRRQSVEVDPEAHEGAVVGVAVSGDGTKFASIGADKSLKVWEAAPGDKEQKEPLTVALAAPASAVTISPDGKHVAASVTNAAGTLLRVFDAVSGKELVSLSDHIGPIRSLSFLADNRTLVSASADKTVRLSDVNLLAVIDAHTGGVAGCAFLPDGAQAISAGADKTVKLWNLTTGKLVRTFGPMPDAVTAVTVSKDGLQFGAAAGKTVKIWTIADAKEIAMLAHPADVAALWFSPDKTKIATAAADGFARIWDAANGQELQSFPHTGGLRAVVYHPNAPAVVVGGADKTATIESFSLARSVAVGSPVKGLAATANGSFVLTAGVDGKVKVWNTSNGAKERTFDASDKPVQAVAVSKNNLYIAAGGADQLVRLYTFADGKLLAAIKTPGPIRGLSFSANNQMLAAACEDKSIQTWSIGPPQNGQPLTADLIKPLQTYTHDAAADDVAFALDGNTLYSAKPRIKRLSNGKSHPTDRRKHSSIRISWTPWRLTIPARGWQRVVTTAKCEFGMSLRVNRSRKSPHIRCRRRTANSVGPAAIYCVAWSADGKQILSGSLDTSLKLWDATTGALVREFHGYKPKEFEKGHRDGVFTAVFSPDGKSMVSGSSDRSIKVWNLADGNVTRDLTNPNLKTGGVAHGASGLGLQRPFPAGRPFGERRRRSAQPRLPGDLGC